MNRCDDVFSDLYEKKQLEKKETQKEQYLTIVATLFLLTSSRTVKNCPLTISVNSELISVVLMRSTAKSEKRSTMKICKERDR